MSGWLVRRNGSTTIPLATSKPAREGQIDIGLSADAGHDPVDLDIARGRVPVSWSYGEAAVEPSTSVTVEWERTSTSCSR